MQLVIRSALLLLLCSGASAQTPIATPEIDLPAIVSLNSRTFAFEDGTLSGPGAEFLKNSTARSQFVLLGESHNLHSIPIFAGALFVMLRSNGFHHLIVEQDRIAVEEALAPIRRGDVAKLGAFARKYPNLYEFPSDEDLDLLALVGRLEKGSGAICGLEQALGPVRYFDELARATQNAAANAEIASLRTLALRLDPDPTYSVNFFMDPTVQSRLDRLRVLIAAKPNSRADEMLLALSKSAEIFGYYRRANAGENVGLYNNTVREAWFKRQFMRCYRRMLRTEQLPKALFKFGGNHMYRGRNPIGAFTIGNFAHEFAISHDKDAYGILSVSLANNGYEKISDAMRVILPSTPPNQPTLVDLRALRPLQRIIRRKLKPEQVQEFLDVVNGFDAIAIFPEARDASAKWSGL